MPQNRSHRRAPSCGTSDYGTTALFFVSRYGLRTAALRHLCGGTVKILFLTSRLPYPPFRGDKLRVFHFIRELSKKHDIILASFIEPHETELLKGLEPYCKRIDTVPLNKTRSYANCLAHVLSRTPFQVFYYASPAMERLVSRLVAEEKPDVIHAHLFRMAPYALGHDIPRVLDLCDSIALNYERFLKYRRDVLAPIYRIEKSKVARYERDIVRRFDRSVVVSPVDKAYLRGGNQEDSRVDVVSNGVDLDYFKPGPLKEPGPRVVFTGTISYFPNYDGVLYFHGGILPLVRQAVSNAEFYVVGNNPPAEVKRLAQKGNTVVTGFVEDVRPYVASASVVVCPLRAATGLQNKILEGMAMAVPVVATSLALEGIDATPGRDVLVADEPESFARAVVELLKDGERARELGEAGRRLVEEKYSWARAAAQLDTIYHSITS